MGDVHKENPAPHCMEVPDNHQSNQTKLKSSVNRGSVNKGCIRVLKDQKLSPPLSYPEEGPASRPALFSSLTD